MSLQTLIANDFEAFQHYAADKQIVLLHPESRLRSMLVAYLLSNSDKPVYYYAMGPNDVNLGAFVDGFTHDLAVQHPVFGRHLFQLYNRSNKADMETAVQAFIRDLTELSADDFLLILDEFDATDEADEIHAFWERVVHHLPPQCQLVINGRTEPRIPWVALIARGQAVIMRDDDIIRENFYRHDTVENPDIFLNTYGFGPGYVQHDKGEIGEWEGHLPRLLFFFVMDRPVVTRAEICNTFWPDLTIDQAVNVFHVTKRRLHKALGFDALVHQDGYYQINPTIKVDYDVENFTTALVKARESEDPQEAMQLFQQAVDLYGGPFLQGHTEQWIVERRDEFLFGYLEAMQSIARIRLDDDRPEQALAILNRAVNEHELYEPIHRDIMQLYADLGRRSEAAGHYQKLTSLLKDNGVKPEPATIELYNQLMTQ